MFKKTYRHRWLAYLLAIVIVPLLWVLTNPDNGFITNLKYGADITVFMVILSRAVIAGALLHMLRKLLNDYPSANIEELLKKAMGESIGAGLAVVGLGIFTLAYAIIILGVLMTP